MNLINLEEVSDWKQALSGEFKAPYFKEICAFLEAEKLSGKIIYPLDDNLFRALALTPLNGVKVVILGQDPYHGKGQAHGLSFSVPQGVKIPPSLANIYKELENDIGVTPPKSGYLEHWAKQGVLLLNSVLSVEAGKAASHQGIGWERFTDAVIRAVNEQKEPVVFMLWGSYAQKKATFVDCQKHLILKAVHPSPLSAYRGFLGCRHFSKANEFLLSHQRTPIIW